MTLFDLISHAYLLRKKLQADVEQIILPTAFEAGSDVMNMLGTIGQRETYSNVCVTFVAWILQLAAYVVSICTYSPLLENFPNWRTCWGTFVVKSISDRPRGVSVGIM